MYSRKSFSNLQALAQGDFGGQTSYGELQGGGPLSHNAAALLKGSRTSMDDMDGRKTSRCGLGAPWQRRWRERASQGTAAARAEPCRVERRSPQRALPAPALPLPRRLIFVTNHLPLKVTKDEVSGWSFERDEDALVLQAKGGLPDDMEAVYVGCLPVEIEGHEQEVGAARGGWTGCVRAGSRAAAGRAAVHALRLGGAVRRRSLII